jgi:hypothetical protein
LSAAKYIIKKKGAPYQTLTKMTLKILSCLLFENMLNRSNYR